MSKPTHRSGNKLNTDKLKIESIILGEKDSSAFQSFFSNSPDGCLICDPASRKIVECIPAIIAMLGKTKSEIVGLTIEDLSPETQSSGTASSVTLKEKINSVLENQSSSCEWAFLDANNQVLFCDVAFSSLSLNSNTYLLCISKNISGLKQEKDELKNANDRFDLAVKGADVGIWQWNLTTWELVWSDRLFSLLGYEPQEFKPTFTLWEKTIHPEDFEHVVAALTDHLEHSKPYVIELRNQCKNGEYKWFKASGFAKRNDNGEPLFMAGSMDDINQQKEAEIANRRLLELLDASSDFIGQADINKNLTYLNPAFKELVGFGQKEEKTFPIGIHLRT